MRLIDADALEKEGWSLHRTIRVDKNTSEYQTKPLKQVPTIEPEIVRCKDCANYDTDWTPETAPDRHYCLVMDGIMPKDGFCHKAERRTDEGD